jgi:hypothetical protein
MDPRGPGLDAVPSIDSMGAGTGWSCGPGLDAQPWIQGTWLEFHRVINADRASMMQSPREGTRCSSLDGSHGRVLDAVPSIDSMGAGTGWSCGPGLDAVPSMDPTGASMMHNHGSMGRDSMQFPQSIPWGPVLVGAAGRDSMHNLGSMGQHDAQPWIHGPA